MPTALETSSVPCPPARPASAVVVSAVTCPTTRIDLQVACGSDSPGTVPAADLEAHAVRAAVEARAERPDDDPLAVSADDDRERAAVRRVDRAGDLVRRDTVSGDRRGSRRHREGPRSQPGVPGITRSTVRVGSIDPSMKSTAKSTIAKRTFDEPARRRSRRPASRSSGASRHPRRARRRAPGGRDSCARCGSSSRELLARRRARRRARAPRRARRAAREAPAGRPA